MSAGRTWLVLRIKPQQHERAADNVRNQRVEFYCPRALVRSPRTRLVRPEPLFPGYAFARPPGEAWIFLKSTIGILDVLMATGEEPARLPDADVERLRAREGDDGLVRLESSQFRPGERLRVDGGLFAELPAEFEAMAGRDRALVLVSLLGRRTRVEVDVRDLSRG